MSVICSECYEDFVYHMNVSADPITCSECMHVGVAPSPADKAKFSAAVAKTRSHLIAAIIPAFLFLGTILFYVSSLNDSGSIEALGSGMHYGLLATLTITFLATMAMAIRYEKNRNEVYF
ncbi:MAG TPA: hypothetical protein EYN79_08215 [Planctomycetes bacterium]|nr:hypothetical protein [Planctomycetota bacterium]